MMEKKMISYYLKVTVERSKEQGEDNLCSQEFSCVSTYLYFSTQSWPYSVNIYSILIQTLLLTPNKSDCQRYFSANSSGFEADF